MWDLRIANPFGRISIRNLFIFVAATVATALAFIILAAPITHAADASWDGDSISYGGNQYTKGADVGDNDSRGLAKGTHVYTYIESIDNGDGTTTQKAHIIYFASKDDPTKTTTAQYVTYDYTPPDTYKNPTDKKPITLDKKSDKKSTSCTIPGIGWLLCPVANYMSGAIDSLYGILAQFLSVRPMETDTNNPLFTAWAIMRNFANVAFVIAFLIIIYSQVTSIGISNYGIKKMLPRLVVAAILVNISYWICAVAIDVSNILGYSLEDLLMSIQKTMQSSGNNMSISWANVTGTLLSGGTLGAIGLISVGSIPGALALLIPLLVGMAVAALIAVIIMAARQAIIIVLVIMAPLAFVAYLLPNTEKYFERWKDLFITMLMLFPIFGVLFGGSQLAGTAIIQNADSLVMFLLGMAVKIAPLVVLPFLLKFSGSLLGRIAGMTNDRTKGLVDRSRTFANDYGASKRAKNLARPNATWRRNALSKAVQGIDNGRRKREGQLKVHEAMADNRWHGTKAHEKIDMASREAARTHQIIEQHHDAHWNNRARTDVESVSQELRLRSATNQASLAKAQLDAMHEEFNAGISTVPAGATDAQAKALTEQFTEARIQARDLAIAGLRKRSAERLQATELTNDLLTNTAQIDGQTLREYAGGVLGTSGAETVLADSISKYRSEYRERVGEKTQLMKHFNLTNDQTQDLALGVNVEVEKNGVRYVFNREDDYAREAAVDHMLSAGSFDQIQSIIMESGESVIDATTGKRRQGKTYAYRTSIRDAVIEKGLQKKALYYGHNTLDDIAQGKINGIEGLNMAAARSLANGKATDEAVSSMGAGALTRMFSVTREDLQRMPGFSDLSVEQQANKLAAFDANQLQLKYSAYRVMHDNLLMRNADATAREVLRKAALPPPDAS